jgi:hypothetical protein
VQRMLDNIAHGQGPPGLTADHLRAAVAKHMPHLQMPKRQLAKKATRTPARR